MTQARAWPNGARWSRDRAAELALEIVKALRPVLMDSRPMSETERIRREALRKRLSGCWRRRVRR